jgi:hypothetical protein
MTRLRRISISLAALLVATASLPTKAALLGYGTNVFDGSWTLVVETKRGSCLAAVRADVRILGGQVLSTDASYRIDGRVARNGAVQAQVAAAGQSGGAYGHLFGEVGQGSLSSLS